MAWIKATTLAQLENEPRYTTVLDGQKVLLALHEGKIYAMQSQCPHFKLPLTNGVIENNTITCPFHKSEFCLDSGEVKCWSPWPKIASGLLGKLSKPKNLKLYPTRIEAGEVLVEMA